MKTGYPNRLSWGWGLPEEDAQSPRSPPRAKAQWEVGSAGPTRLELASLRTEPTPAPLALMGVCFLAAISKGCSPRPLPFQNPPLPISPSSGNHSPLACPQLVLGSSGLTLCPQSPSPPGLSVTADAQLRNVSGSPLGVHLPV